jgi:RHS repeat-associated protein
VEILRYSYDAASRLSSRWSTAKGDTYYAYDPVGNLTNIDYAVSTDVSFQYDALNRAITMVDAVGTTAYGYAAGGQLWTEDGPFGSDTVTNSYSNRLRTGLSLAQPTGSWTNGFGYDAAKRLTNVTSQAGTFIYTLGGVSYASPLPKKILLPNTSYITNTYDSVARLTGTWLKNSSHSTLNSHEYTYNQGNQRTQQVFSAGSTYTYAYDPIGQLNVADSATASEDRGYAYDPAWNLHYRTNNGTLNTFIVDGKNQVTNAPSPESTASYDGNGNMVTNHNGDWAYVYDDENRLIQFFKSHFGTPLNATEFVYDGLGRLRERLEYTYAPSLLEGDWSLDSETRYIYDGWRVIQERDWNNTPTVSYTRGNDLSGSLQRAGGIGGLLGRSHGYSGGNWSTHNFYHADGNGNITYLVDSSQTLAASYRYDPYGTTISSSGSLASANVYRFSSKEIHVNSGLYYYGFRWYAPNLQRWLNRDPVGEYLSINLYAFLENEPSDLFDNDGLAIGPRPGGGRGGVKPDGTRDDPRPFKKRPLPKPIDYEPHDHEHGSHPQEDCPGCDDTNIAAPEWILHNFGHAVVAAIEWVAKGCPMPSSPPKPPSVPPPPGSGCSTCPINAPPPIIITTPPPPITLPPFISSPWPR